jgi:DNA-binding MarR family transcriptional regulator
MEDDPDTKSFVLRSNYRLQVVQALARSGQLTPTSIAENTDVRQPHVSRALSELRDEGLVTLAVSESQHKGRLYELTQSGDEIWSTIDPVKWQGSIDSIPDSHRQVIRRFQREAGDQLRLAGFYEGSSIHNYYMCDGILTEFSEKQVENMIKTVVHQFTHTHTDTGGMAGELAYEIQSFAELYRILMYTDRGVLAVGLDPECQFDVRGVVEECVAILERHSAE